MALNVEIFRKPRSGQSRSLSLHGVVRFPHWVRSRAVEVFAIPVELLPPDDRGKMVLEPRQGRRITQIEVRSTLCAVQQPIRVFCGQHRQLIGPGHGVGVADPLRLEPQHGFHPMLPGPIREGGKALGELGRVRFPETGGVEKDKLGLCEWQGLGFGPPSVAGIHPAKIRLDACVEELLDSRDLRLIESSLDIPDGALASSRRMRQDGCTIPPPPEILGENPVATFPKHHGYRGKPHRFPGPEFEMRLFLSRKPSHSLLLGIKSGRPLAGPAQDKNSSFLRRTGEIEIRPAVGPAGGFARFSRTENAHCVGFGLPFVGRKTSGAVTVTLNSVQIEFGAFEKNIRRQQLLEFRGVYLTLVFKKGGPLHHRPVTMSR